MIVVYGPPGTGKTTACEKLPLGTRWIITDSNTAATLQARGTLPPAKHTYSNVKDLASAKDLVYRMLDAIEKKGLRIPAVVLDSLTALNDWHQQDVAREHGQQWMGQNQKESHWQNFNTSMGNFIDALGALAKRTHVIVICHAGEKFDSKKGQWSGLSLTPKMQERMSRVANWVLFAASESRALGEGETSEPDAFSEIVTSRDGFKSRVIRTLHTKPVGNWITKCANRNLDPEEPNDVAAILRKEGLLE